MEVTLFRGYQSFCPRKKRTFKHCADDAWRLKSRIPKTPSIPSDPTLPVVKRRNPLVYTAAVLIVIVWGLASRKYPGMFPAVLGKLPGDTLWTLMIFLGCGILGPRASTWRLGWVSLAISWAIEFFQLYQTPWLQSIRATTLGHLVPGSGFYTADLIAYAVGSAMGVLLERAFGWIPRR